MAAKKSPFRRKFLVSFEMTDTNGMLDDELQDPREPVRRFGRRAARSADIKAYVREALSIKSAIFLTGLVVSEAPAVLPRRKAPKMPRGA